MRSWLWIAAAAFSLAIYGARADEIPSQLARVEQADDARFQPAEGTIPVFSIPEFITKANRKWRDLFTNALLDRGEIKTGPRGLVVLGLANGRKLRLGPSSNLVLEQLRHEKESGATELELRSGEVNCQPAEQARSDRAIIVRTAAVTVKAGGPSFSVRHAGDKELTTVRALEGSVRVERRDDAAAVTIPKGQQISISKTDSEFPQPRPID